MPEGTHWSPSRPIPVFVAPPRQEWSDLIGITLICPSSSHQLPAIIGDVRSRPRIENATMAARECSRTSFHAMNFAAMLLRSHEIHNPPPHLTWCHLPVLPSLQRDRAPFFASHWSPVADRWHDICE